LPPTLHWGVESKIPWIRISDDLPQLTTKDDPEFTNALVFTGNTNKTD
jgi:hypothetical protein